MGNLCADHVTPVYPQMLALTSPTGGGRSVGIVRVRSKATEFVLFVLCGVCVGFFYIIIKHATLHCVILHAMLALISLLFVL